MVHQTHPWNDSGPSARLHLADEDATLAAGGLLAAALPRRLTILLRGDLGAGKTTLTRGLLRGMGFTGRVKSPTYTLVEPYKDSRISVYHFDFYRFTHAEEFLEAGLEEYFEGDGIRLVEWPDRAHPYLPAADLEVLLHVAPSGGRELALRALSSEGQTCLDDFIARTASWPPARPTA
ncbi:MAG: tRNA (adenosine(37)-N6)-threonylcarbamoyltransferase complex ATPase subunit type 1 TsaE [Zoogloea sp.]|uniref:tRNA (adenosine(37)-N6)-threonylcarbamoyltransferase complex ATPase subunit type 1 TsaE n=1 Tax=Zoogloea sp. TaxID=49181 RepID=UPI002609249F|nr:tRNA (adenosine(37)-N6)-threonylcarbamoyltransferase complex ATPase subunit type 1 TsaE [Zoogloea sp.]MDD3329295.1 tRNA (adenosine(37)-N6)-threonylcarbamoyltransferase complex ATPase subunit type 1 TsaE [Zoogloea sp.]